MSDDLAEGTVFVVGGNSAVGREVLRDVTVAIVAVGGADGLGLVGGERGGEEPADNAGALARVGEVESPDI